MRSLPTRLIDVYRWWTWPARKVRLQHLKRTGQVPVIVLFYHRVDDEHPNAWTIENDEFAAQIDWMQEHFDLVSLEECQRRIRSGFNDRPTISITFDDGYADNCHLALPKLISRGIPVTYFVTTRHAVEETPFAHDVELGRPLPTNDIETLRALVAAGVEIGGHNRDHVDLGPVRDSQVIYDQVITASRELGKLVGQKIRYFAFPFGQPDNLNREAFDILHDHEIEAVCSAYGGFNPIGSEGFHIQRMHGDPNFSRLKNWLTYDPRLSLKTLYDYERRQKKRPKNTVNRSSVDPAQATTASDASSTDHPLV